MKSAEIRERFLRFFEEHSHDRLPSASLVPQNDPTLYFVNAGMVPFKDIFTGAESTERSRATTAQRCMRVSGKQNDLDNVGRTARHHTFFEMLGNFSFGDYFKEDAIQMAWSLLTEGFGIDPERLWVTVYEDDDETADIWIGQVGVPAERLQRMGEKDNFWSMGDTGPCGPCSEIHYDHGPEHGPGGGPATESPRYVEIWNLVFMQYEQAADGTRTPLPRPSIDTGMGLERLTAVLQGVYSNYDTDLFRPILRTAADIAGVPYGAGEDSDIALRVIADHARATAFLIADGVRPSNEGRGYVLRRVMRRAIRFGVKLDIEPPFLFKCVDTVIREMHHAYPELAERRDYVLEVVQAEERRFAETLGKGLHLLEQELQALDPSGERVLSGEVVFKLYDTHGFPPDLTALIAEERGVTIDQAGFDTEMARQRALARAAWKGSGDAMPLQVQRDLADTFPPTGFLGYTTDRADSTVLALVRDGERVTALSEGDEGLIIVQESPFYAESGGQVGDTGAIGTPQGQLEVTGTRKGLGGLVLHVGRVTRGRILEGETATLDVAGRRRDRTRLNHTATHLLHAALREILGDHVTQQGSLVDPERLRFDFSHHKPLSDDELRQLEDRVYGQILRNAPVTTEVKDLEQARADGAMALFGEKYDANVRVVSVPGFSVELCGGTHARRTGDIGAFRITAETGVAAGVRRIEAVTGAGALDWLRARDDAASTAASRLRTNVEGLDEAVERLIADRKRLEKELDAMRRELARAATGDVADQAREVDGFKVLAAEVPGDANTLRDEADRLRDQLGSALVVLGSRSEGKVLLIAAATRDIAGKKVHAGNVIREVAKAVGGGGGGRPDMAQAGGKNADALPDALALVYTLVGA
ncbi:MAG: alanine--tRNA ligase [Alphaproteobacteria bacterium]|nr:alanine--tRNA ligase [Alphaproteobacteria bacterium]